MGSVASVVWDGVTCPVTVLLTVAICWIWIKIFIQDWDPRHFTLSYSDLAQRKQYWRIFLSPLTHTSLPVLILNATLLWNLRVVEKQFGILFFLRYSVLLILSETILAQALMYLFMRITSNPDIRQLITNTSTMGSSGLILAWLAFLSVVVSDMNPRNFMLFGIFNINPVVTPIVVILLYYFLLPGGYAYSNLGSLFSGYLLAGGVLQVLPGAFWSLCFLVDTALIVTVSVLFRESGAAETPAPEYVNIGDVLDVQEIGPARMIGGFNSTNDLRDLLDSRDDDSPIQASEDDGTLAGSSAGMGANFGSNSRSMDSRIEEGRGGDGNSNEDESSEENISERAPLLGSGPPSLTSHNSRLELRGARNSLSPRRGGGSNDSV